VQDCSPEVLASRKCKTSAQPGNHQHDEQDRENTHAVSHWNPEGRAQDDTLAVLVEKRDQAITAFRENWKRISSLGSAAKDEAGHSPSYARNVELRPMRLVSDLIICDSPVFRGRIGFVDSIHDFVH
jgi:hypothetical protein